MFSKIILALAVAATAYAAPGHISSGEADTDATVCGNGQALACCGTNGDANQSLVSGVNCLSIPIIAVPIQQACGSNVAACCPHDGTSGAIAVGLNCNAIPV